MWRGFGRRGRRNAFNWGNTVNQELIKSAFCLEGISFTFRFERAIAAKRFEWMVGRLKVS